MPSRRLRRLDAPLVALNICASVKSLYFSRKFTLNTHNTTPPPPPPPPHTHTHTHTHTHSFLSGMGDTVAMVTSHQAILLAGSTLIPGLLPWQQLIIVLHVGVSFKTPPLCKPMCVVLFTVANILVSVQ